MVSHAQPGVAGLQAAASSEDTEVRKDWKLKQIDPVIIQEARRKAKNQGMRLGTWVAHTIAAAGKVEDKATNVGANENIDALLFQKISALEEKIEREIAENSRRFSDLQKEVRLITHCLLPNLK